MRLFLTLAYLFCGGACFGWVLELLFRRFFSQSNPERKWINPGFCVGPYIPLYGFGLCLLYLLARLEPHLGISNPVLRKGLLIVLMAIALTGIEYLAGVLCLKLFKVRLWDYSQMRWNIQGLICPLFTLFWAAASALYLLLIHTHILGILARLSGNLTFAFIVGFFYGVFLVDVAYSSRLITKIKAYAKENDVVVKWERLKSELKEKAERLGEKTSFLFPLRLSHLVLKRREREKKPNEERESAETTVAAEERTERTP